MKFGCFFVGQRPQLHEQYADESKVNPNPVRRSDQEVYDDILRGAVLAEELGFDSVWVAEHAFSEHSIVSSPHSILAAVAAKTERVNIGVACTIVPWHPPLRMAQDLATLDVLSNGRLIVGAGRGYQKREFDVYGVDMSEARERLVEGMDIAVKAWTEDRFAYDGQFSSFPEVMVLPKPIQKPHPEIWMAVTHSPQSVDVAVSHRWGLFTVGSTFFPAAGDADQDLINLYYSKMLDSGVAPEDITVAAVRNMYVAQTDDEALEVMKPRLEWAGDMGTFLRRPAAAMAAAGRISGYEEYANDPFIDPAQAERRAPQSMGAIGSPEKLRATVQDLESRHVSHFLGFMDTGGLSYDEIQGSLRLFAKEVMPHFK